MTQKEPLDQGIVTGCVSILVLLDGTSLAWISIFLNRSFDSVQCKTINSSELPNGFTVYKSLA